MNKESLKKFVEENPKLVSMRPAGDGLFVLKYKKTVFFNNLWNDFLEECRGTIVDSDFNLVSYPFTKVYNYGVEDKAPVLPPGTYVDAYRKVNGFMVAVTWHNNDLLVSTTGSTDSDYVDMAKELIEPNLEKFRKTCKDYSCYTFMFEAVHKNDPHIIVEQEGLYLLGLRSKFLGSPMSVSNALADNFGCYPVEHVHCTIETLQLLTKHVRHEGFVFYTEDGVSAKIKSPYYLTSKWVARNPRTDKLVDMKNDIKKNIDEEYYGLIDAIRLNIETYTAMNEQERLEWVRKFLGEV
jgi:hypothetical protein